MIGGEGIIEEFKPAGFTGLGGPISCTFTTQRVWLFLRHHWCVCLSEQAPRYR